jgi:hypothetical protein
MAQQSFCTEARVREIVQQEVARSVIRYERTIGQPRHEANQKLINKIDGGVTTLKWIASTALALFTAYIAWRHH